MVKKILQNSVIGAALVFVTISPAHADQRTAALADRFAHYCIQKKPSFERVDGIATKLNWHVKSEGAPSLPAGSSVHSKSWLMKDDTGTYELGVGKAKNSGSRTESCGINATDASGDLMIEEIEKTLKVGEPSKQIDSADGRRTLTFWKAMAENTPVTIMLTYDKGSDKGFYVNAYAETPAN